MLFFISGKVAHPIRFDDVRQEARFTMRDKNDRFYFVTCDPDQYHLLKRHQDHELIMIGKAFSFPGGDNNSRKHQVGFEPIVLFPVKESTRQGEVIQQVVRFLLNNAQV